MIVSTYVDDCIVTGNTEQDIKGLFKPLNAGDENYDFTDEGDLKIIWDLNLQDTLVEN